MKKLVVLIAVAAAASAYAQTRRGLGLTAGRAAVEATRGLVGGGSDTPTRETSARERAERAPEAPSVAESPAPQQVTEANKAEEAKEAPVDISKIADDNEFFAAFKEKGKTEDAALLERCRNMKDEKLLAEFVRLRPDQAKAIVEDKCNRATEINSASLAETLIDNLQNPRLKEKDSFMFPAPGLCEVLFRLVSRLDGEARAKYLAKAQANREKVSKDTVVFEKFYVGMPVLDYVVISFEDNLSWTKETGALANGNYLEIYLADMKSDIDGKDWREAFKMKSFRFAGKERYKYFKTKGTRDGLLAFAKKYMDTTASSRDITVVDGGLWQYTDEEHALTVWLNDEDGNFGIQEQE